MNRAGDILSHGISDSKYIKIARKKTIWEKKLPGLALFSGREFRCAFVWCLLTVTTCRIYIRLGRAAIIYLFMFLFYSVNCLLFSKVVGSITRRFDAPVSLTAGHVMVPSRSRHKQMCQSTSLIPSSFSPPGKNLSLLFDIPEAVFIFLPKVGGNEQSLLSPLFTNIWFSRIYMHINAYFVRITQIMDIPAYVQTSHLVDPFVE